MTVVQVKDGLRSEYPAIFSFIVLFSLKRPFIMLIKHNRGHGCRIEILPLLIIIGKYIGYDSLPLSLSNNSD